MLFQIDELKTTSFFPEKVQQSFVAIFRNQKDSIELVKNLDNLTVVVPNTTNVNLDGSTKSVTISIIDRGFLKYSNIDSSTFYIVVGGKVENNKSQETIIYPVKQKSDVNKAVGELQSKGYSVFSPTINGFYPPLNTITGETLQVSFNNIYFPGFPDISTIKPYTKDQSLWIVIGVNVEVVTNRFISGYIDKDGKIQEQTGNFSIEKLNTGLYKLKFKTFPNRYPSVTATQIFTDKGVEGGDTRDNVVISSIQVDNLEATVVFKTGDSLGQASDREFSFIALL
ncbi:hypothetical protein LC613_42545 [Nostoc sphaeroides CHAB 2801]|uniref:hypothetical protein n=1 Tax=Nostoc sphaeroides TaxID=446679 RepID=UPI000E48F224|nr:hypothetical protein [Nostoc sphaeroides]MCC5634089.1 hypothetical protein [Nostoc sphaeroides CHAB 2801]